MTASVRRRRSPGGAPGSEPPRVDRRLRLFRGWGHEQTRQADSGQPGCVVARSAAPPAEKLLRRDREGRIRVSLARDIHGNPAPIDPGTRPSCSRECPVRRAAEIPLGCSAMEATVTARSWRWKVPPATLLLVSSLILGTTGAAAAVEWEDMWSRPAARYVPAVAYDSARGREVLFGGYHDPDSFADTWEYGLPLERTCDGVDDNGNGSIDEGCDDDLDGYCDPTMTVVGSPAACPGGGGDCNDGNSSVISPPVAVAGLDVTDTPGGYRFSWTDQVPTAGSGTKYDVFLGGVSGLRPGSDFATGSCYSRDLTTPCLDYIGPDPPVEQAFYFMIRGQNGDDHAEPRRSDRAERDRSCGEMEWDVSAVLWGSLRRG